MSDVYLLALGTEGEVEALPQDTDVVELIGSMDVFMCPDHRHVGLVGATSAIDNEPENHLGWLCYGRSMLHGTVLIKRDDSDPISHDLLAMINNAGQLVRDGFISDANVVAADFWAGYVHRGPRPKGGVPKKEKKAKDPKREKVEKEAKKEKDK